MPTYRLDIEYDGSPFSGWQIQPDQPSVQAAIEDALAIALRTPHAIVGSGRTDTGVHARGQVAHFRTDAPLDTYRTQRALNGLLPVSIAILGLQQAADTFHARYDAYRRVYHYHATTQPRALDQHTRYALRPVPDFDAMNAAAMDLLGTHDFSSFCRTKSETTNRVCTIYEAHWLAEPRPNDWVLRIVGDRFLHGMVRAITGTLLQIGRGKRPLDDLPRILAARDRRVAGPAAPAHGLVLQQVCYPSD